MTLKTQTTESKNKHRISTKLKSYCTGKEEAIYRIRKKICKPYPG
jgi:hypothetical protein